MSHLTTPAERMRAHREAFMLALELDCTPREAEAEIVRRKTRLRWLAADQRAQDLFSAPIRPGAAASERRDAEPWMMRD